MCTFDSPLVGGLRLGLLDFHLPHHLLNNNNKPLMGLPGPKKEEWQMTKESDLLRTLLWRVLARPSLVASWRPPELQLGLRRVANVGKGRLPPLLSSPVWRGPYSLMSWRLSGSSHYTCSRW